MFNICRSKFKIRGSNKFNDMLCRSLISNLCAHCEIWNRHRGTPSTEDGGAAAPSVPRSGCSPRVFSADCCSWLLGMFKHCLEGSRYAPVEHGNPFQPTGRENLLLCFLFHLLPLHCSPQKQLALFWHSTKPAGKGGLSVKPLAKLPACHWFPGFIFLGRSISVKLFSRCLQSFPMMFKSITEKRRFNCYHLGYHGLKVKSRRNPNKIYDL